ncbi:hypothetical protein Bca52824_003278 [Brassica carinata]|uniref:Uncharacterized protein n=1 Tax=Brassica carinata TaxID=52824 RepID=A0A8X7WPZ1_BRACI|nr:hypothetical protein Bca52824_003278 [Brassica carinata]
MANSYTFLADSKAGRCSNTAETFFNHINQSPLLKLQDKLGELFAIRSTTCYAYFAYIKVLATFGIPMAVIFYNYDCYRPLHGNFVESLQECEAFAFHDKFESYGSEPKVVLVISINPKVFGDTAVGIEHCEKYRVELSVSDQTDGAVFVAFDVKMAKLTNIQAAEAAHILGGGHGTNDDMPREYPVASIRSLLVTTRLLSYQMGVR